MSDEHADAAWDRNLDDLFLRIGHRFGRADLRRRTPSDGARPGDVPGAGAVFVSAATGRRDRREVYGVAGRASVRRSSRV